MRERRRHLEREVARLRADGLHREALGVARELRDRCDAASGARPDEIGDATRQIETLEHILALPEDDRAACARADSLGPRIEAALAEERFADAVALAEEQLKTRERIFGRRHAETARSIEALGWCHLEYGNIEAAEPLAHEVAELRETLLEPDHPDFAKALRNVGGLHYAKADLATAEALVRRAVTIWTATGEETKALAEGIYNLARVVHEVGRFAEAETLYESGLAMQQRIDPDDAHVVPHTLAHVARLVITQGDEEGGEAMLRRAIAIAERHGEKGRRARLQALRTLVGALAWRGAHEEADALWPEVLEITRSARGPRHPIVANMLREWAESFFARERFEDAERLMREVLAVRKERLSDEHPVTAATYLELARAIARRGDRATALECLCDAIPKMEPMGRESGTVVAALIARGGLERSEGLLEESEASLSDAAERFEIARERLREGVGRAVFAKSPYPDLALTQLARGLGDDAWISVETGLGRLLEDHERLLDGAAALTETPDLARLQATLGTTGAVLGWLDVRARAVDAATWGFVIRAHGPVRWVDLSGEGERPARDLAASYLAHMRARGRSALGATDEGLDAIEEAILRSRIDPLLGQLDGVESLLVVASGDLVGVPLEGLLARRDVTRRTTIAYVPSARTFLRLCENGPSGSRDPDRRRRALLVGDPPFRLGHAAQEAEPVEPVTRGHETRIDALPRLHGSRAEVLSVAEHFQEPTIRVGRDASAAALRDLAATGRLRDFDVLHFATHALVNTSRPDLSALVLSQVDLPDPIRAAIAGEPIERGLVTAGDVASTWRLDAELVVLSACDTGGGRNVHGEGLVGFVHAFLQAGARSLLVTLWPVDDAATRLLMHRFYESWLSRGASKAAALRDAQAWLRTHTDESGLRPYRDAFHWAPFVLFGDPS